MEKELGGWHYLDSLIEARIGKVVDDKRTVHSDRILSNPRYNAVLMNHKRIV